MDAAIIIGTYIIVFFAGYGLRAYMSRRRRRRCFTYDFPPDGTRTAGDRGEATGVRSHGDDDEEEQGAAGAPPPSPPRSPVWRRAMSAVTNTTNPFGARVTEKQIPSALL